MSEALKLHLTVDENGVVTAWPNLQMAVDKKVPHHVNVCMNLTANQWRQLTTAARLSRSKKEERTTDEGPRDRRSRKQIPGDDRLD